MLIQDLATTSRPQPPFFYDEPREPNPNLKPKTNSMGSNGGRVRQQEADVQLNMNQELRQFQPNPSTANEQSPQKNELSVDKAAGGQFSDLLIHDMDD